MSTKSSKFLSVLSFVLIALISGCATFNQAEEIDDKVKRIDQKLDTLKKIDTKLKLIEQKLDSMIKKAEPVTKDAASAIATKFASLETVTAIRQPEVAYSHTKTINVMGNDGIGDILIGVNPLTGEVIKMVKQCPYPGRDSENVVISRDQAVLKAKSFLGKHGLPPIPQDYIMDKARLITTWRKKHWEIVWHHYVGGVQVLSDFISFLVNPENGDVISYSKVYHAAKVSHQPQLISKEAIKLARAELGKGNLTHYNPLMKVLRTELKILYPNNYFKDFVWHWSDSQALAWIVQFGDDGEAAIDVWIDALTGHLLGGRIYEKPIPELWGVPDQITDVTNYPGWEPAFDEIQFNTSHTFLGNASETKVVNSIKNGMYFVFHSHGRTSDTNEEYADLEYKVMTDQTMLTPDEIPQNDLRYVLMSCCKCGHDGPGDDFKDVFIKKGADVFQSYKESMDPDEYENSMLRYLAEGQSLWNAHWNAVADINPKFTIIIEYGPRLLCFNQLRLAPLHVDAVAPKLVSGSNAVTIKATVRNREDARETTARNVTATLVVPAGFSLIEGASSQTISSLKWNNSWTAKWTVQKNDSKSGSGTFDILVNSDNLGVAVDEYHPQSAFDYPDHPVTVDFSFP